MTYNQQLLGRVVVPASGEEDDYEPDDIPKLWQCKQTRTIPDQLRTPTPFFPPPFCFLGIIVGR